MKCLNCGWRKAVRPGRLCCPCHGDRAVRRRFPGNMKYAPKTDSEPTAAELDAMIAEQLPTMPTGRPGEAPNPHLDGRRPAEGGAA